MTTGKYTNLARAAWEEAAPIHWQTTQRLLADIKDSGRRDIDDIHADELARIGVKDAAIAQMNCNNGIELISIKRLGAGRCVGFDIANGFILQARALAEAAGADCEFVCSDVYRISTDYDNRFDIVTVTAGAIWFMPDLSAYFQIAGRLLKDGGRFSLYESHPITTMFTLDRDTSNSAYDLAFSYFDSEPRRHDTGLDYQGGTTYAAKPVYKFPYRLDEILQAVLDAGLTIERFVEHDQDPSKSVQRLEGRRIRMPLSILLTARKALQSGAASGHR